MHEVAAKIQLTRLKRQLQKFTLLTREEVSDGDVYYLVYRDLLEDGAPKLFAALHLNRKGVRLTLHPKDLELIISLPRFAAIKHYYIGSGILQFTALPRELDHDIIALLKALYILNNPDMNRIVILPSNDPLPGTPKTK